MKTLIHKLTIGAAALAAGVFSVHPQVQAQFTAGDLVVERIGDGTTTLSGNAAAVSVVEFAPTGAAQSPAFTINLPTTGASALTDSGTGTSDGYLNLSADGTTLVLPGYRANTGTATVASATGIARVIGTIGATGAFNTTTSFTDGYVGNNFRGVASPDGNTFFTSGTAGTGNTATAGVRTLTLGSTSSSSVSIAPQTNLRNTEIYNGGLYYSTGSGGTTGVGIYQVNTNLSITSGQTALLLINTVTANPYGFAISPDGKTVYVAEEAGGINKYTSATGAAGSFTLAGSFGAGTAARGLSVDFSGTNPLIYATSTATTNNNLFEFADAGSFTVTPTILASAGTNEVFRGVDFAPASVPEPATVLGGVLLLGAAGWSQRRRLARGA